jgi:arylsulfate sulfotransferase
MSRIVVACICLFAIITLIAGCSSSSTPPVTLTLTPTSATLFATQVMPFSATDSLGNSDVAWAVTTANGGSIDSNGNYTAPSVTAPTVVNIRATSLRNTSVFASAAVTIYPSGQVTSTINPQVALYTLNLPAGTNAYIQFSTDTSYNLKTWTQPAPANGVLSFYVAGMLASTEYHMQAVLPGTNGPVATDLDHTFTTQAVAAAAVPGVTATTYAGMTPQSGIEILNLLQGGTQLPQLAAFDLSGNMIWSIPQQKGLSYQGVHLLPNGHFLIGDALEEVDLAGNIIQKATAAQVEAGWAKQGINYTINEFHHDAIPLPNGHWLTLFNMYVECSAIANCNAGQVNILGDGIVELAPQGDGTFLPVWTWSTFDHLDINRAPQGYPDWTHSNALVYSSDDGNLLLSIRSQSWIIKIDYENGSGDGHILWHLGYQGDFTLEGGTDPYDWFYMQHGPSFTTSNTTGQFGLAVMDNGNDRPIIHGATCINPTCTYSRGVTLQLDETAMTATLLTAYAPSEYSFWGGNAEQLANGNLEADFNAGSPAGFSDIFEVTSGGSPQPVWKMETSNANAYRGFRLPSLYPGVQW